MFFRKRDKNATERVEDLKARVDSLRHIDDQRVPGPKSLNDFLSGDDVVTARDPDMEPLSSDHAQTDPGELFEAYEEQEVDLEGELERYLARERERARSRAEPGVESEPEATWAFEQEPEPEPEPAPDAGPTREQLTEEWLRWSDTDRPRPPPPQTF